MLRPYKCSGLVFGPAEVDESLVETGEREADDVEVAAFDARNEAAGAALNGVGAGFVVRFARGKVAGDFLVIELGEMDVSGFDESAAFGVGKADEGDTREDGVRAAGKFFEHVAGVGGGGRLSQEGARQGETGTAPLRGCRAPGEGGDAWCGGEGKR